MKIMIKTLTAAILATCVVASPAIARPGQGGHAGGPPGIETLMHLSRHLEHVADEINVTQEQRDAIRGIIDMARPQFREVGDAIRANHELIRTVSSPESYDAEAVAILADEQGALVSQMMILGAQTKVNVLSVLTVEQREQLTAMREERRSRWGGKRGK